MPPRHYASARHAPCAYVAAGVATALSARRAAAEMMPRSAICVTLLHAAYVACYMLAAADDDTLFLVIYATPARFHEMLAAQRGALAGRSCRYALRCALPFSSRAAPPAAATQHHI